MIMISGLWITTQSESITSPQNNDKIPSTNMHTTLKPYPGFDLPQTMRGMMFDLEVEMVLMLGMKMHLPTQRRSRWQFPTNGSSKMTGSDPSRGGRRVPPPLVPQKIPGKI
jgi:hypothetical protein